MFEVGFTELLLIFALALVVLGPRRLPELASRVGRWVGKARAMARQLREQLDQEVTFEESEATRRRQPPAAAAATTATAHDTDLEVDSQGRPYYPADHHEAGHAAHAQAEPTPSIVPPASAPASETPDESSPPDQAPDEQRERRSS